MRLMTREAGRTWATVQAVVAAAGPHAMYTSTPESKASVQTSRTHRVKAIMGTMACRMGSNMKYGACDP
jgi:hypothetical protein